MHVYHVMTVSKMVSATCNDGQQNGNETGVDCGGDCDACPTCDDGIQNGNETGVDCGGDCNPCSTGCDDTAVNLTITLDNYPEETAWTLVFAVLMVMVLT